MKVTLSVYNPDLCLICVFCNILCSVLCHYHFSPKLCCFATTTANNNRQLLQFRLTNDCYATFSSLMGTGEAACVSECVFSSMAASTLQASKLAGPYRPGAKIRPLSSAGLLPAWCVCESKWPRQGRSFNQGCLKSVRTDNILVGRASEGA